jgi:hypothetical protein
MMRVEPEGIANRTIQQINFIVRKVDFKLAHRISCDQTFENGQSTEYRFRYRLSSEIPFSGQTLDVKEFFIKLSNEYLNSFLEGAYDLEIRGLGFVGYMLSPNTKLELGLDYRIDSFLNESTRQRFWTSFNVYLSI